MEGEEYSTVIVVLSFAPNYIDDTSFKLYCVEENTFLL